MREVNEASRASSRINRANKASSRVNKVNKATAARKVSRVSEVKKGSRANRVNRVNQASRVNQVNNKGVNKPEARRTVVTAAATGNMQARNGDQSVVTGATIVNSPPRYANVYVKPRTCDASGAPPGWAPAASTK
jgi:hypothetical protein